MTARPQIPQSNCFMVPSSNPVSTDPPTQYKIAAGSGLSYDYLPTSRRVKAQPRARTFCAECGGSKAPLRFLLLDPRTEFPAGEAHRNFAAESDVGGVAHNLSGSVAGDRIAAIEDGERATFSQDGGELHPAVAPVGQAVSELRL